MIRTLAKTAAVVVSSTILATLAVNAADMRGFMVTTWLSALLSQTHEPVGPCPQGAVLVTDALTPFCMDKYEASLSTSCVRAAPANEAETLQDLADPRCTPVSVAGALPWRNVSQAEAAQACARAGKRLPTAREWYAAALGTPDGAGPFTEEGCNLARNRADGVDETGGGMRCVSNAGAYDMVGNVWEWVSDRIATGTWNGRRLPDSGYVTNADTDGIAYTTSGATSDTFGNDRFWLDPSITAGTLRGGYYDSGGNGGVYATYAASPPSFVGDAVGFRCAADVQTVH